MLIKLNVQGKRVILVDDSIVRGTTSRKIVEMLREAGAREVHMRISSPPVKCPCYFGIDTPTSAQLIGANNTIEQIRETIGADSLAYLTTDELLDSVGATYNGFCTGCFDGNYPMPLECKNHGCDAIVKEK